VLEFRILGPLEVLRDGEPLRLGGPKQRATLAILLLGANRVVSVERLADDLYAGAPPATSVTQVQRQVSDLRRILGADTIETRPPGYVLRVDREALDLDRFEGWTRDAIEALGRSEPEVAARLFHRALDLWRGAPLADLTYESFAQSAITHLEELRLAALEHRFDAELELGRHGQVLPELEALVIDHPLRERLRVQLMLALYRAGRQTEALDVYQGISRVLRDELGVEPSPELRLIQRSILRHDPDLLRTGPTTTPLPVQPTSFVGRLDEVAKLVALARRNNVRVITVSGPGGCGKSRLALEAAADCALDEEEIVWVPLAPLIDSSLVQPTIAEALGVVGDPAAHIGNRKLLLLLDNFEHLVDAAPQLTRLLELSPNLRLLVTSRERLKIRGEHEFVVGPLARDDAIELFRQRAQALQPDFQSEALVDELCERLDDLPLALELAAARIKLFSPAQLVEQVDRNLDVLQGGRDAAPAQVTLRATVDWSFGLLTGREQALLIQLSAFAGGWTLESAAAVCGADVERLAALVDKSLVRRLQDRYSMLAVVRAYMSERLASDPDLFDSTYRALARYLVTLVQKGLAGSAQPHPSLSCGHNFGPSSTTFEHRWCGRSTRTRLRQRFC
jgi:predicted ATPase/DNA-binding SARP family transcriptional activator